MSQGESGDGSLTHLHFTQLKPVARDAFPPRALLCLSRSESKNRPLTRLNGILVVIDGYLLLPLDPVIGIRASVF